jgi:RNA polymerase sigma factor for flagellar operon FliA
MAGLQRSRSTDESKDGEEMNRTRVAATPQGLTDLWATYHRTESTAVRDTLIKKYLYLVRYVAGKMAMSVPPSVEIDDLVSSGVVGLMDAIGKYDPGRDTKFETYAVARIRGAIVDDLRSLDWVPRSVRRKARMIEEAYGSLENELGRAASDEEVSRKLNMSVEEFRSIVEEVVSAGLLSLDDFVGNQEGERTTRIIDLVCAKDGVSPSSNIETEEMKDTLANAILNLPEKERTVVALYYYEDMTLKEIGRTLGVSESRVSQIHTKAMLRLRGRLKSVQDSLLSSIAERGSSGPGTAAVADENIARELVSTH